MAGKRGITLLAALCVSITLFVNGCSAPDAEQQVRLQLYSLLDDGAMELSVIGRSSLEWNRRRVENSLERKIEYAANPAERRYLAGVLSLFKLFNAVCAVDSVRGMGRSAQAVSGDTVHETGVLLYDPAGAGLLKDFFNSQDNLDVRGVAADIPTAAAAFFAVDIQVDNLLKALEKCGGFSEIIASKIPAGVPVSEFIKAMSGIWRLTLLPVDKTQTVVKIEIPDKESCIFNMFSAASRQAKGKKRLFLPGFGTFIRKENSLTLYLGGQTEEIFKAAEKKKLDGVDGMLVKMPGKAAFFAYVDPRRINDDLKSVSLGKLSFAALTGAKKPVVLTLSHLAEENGYLVSANGGGKVLTADIELFTDVILPLFSACLPDKKMPEAADTASRITVQQSKCSCSEILTIAAAAVKAAPDAKAGFYRIENGKIVPVQTGKFDFVLLKSKFPSNVLPLFIAPPHKDSFCACGADTNISKYQLIKADSFRRIIGFLHTVYKFDEKVFCDLVVLAGELDRKQEK